MGLLIRLLITAGVSYGLAKYLSGISFSGFGSAIIFAIILGLVNIFIKPIFEILSIPISFITFGLFSLVINAVMVLIADKLTEGMEVDGFISAFIFSILLSIITSIINLFVGES